MSKKKNTDNNPLPEPEHSMQATIQALSEISGIPAFHMQSDSNVDWESPSAPTLCSLFGHRGCVQKTCPIILASAATAATKLHEPYVFLCPCTMVLFACPSSDEKGTFFMGPLMMDENREDAIEKILRHFANDSHRTATAGAFLSTQRIWTPLQISSLFRVLHQLTCVYRPLDPTSTSHSAKASENAVSSIQMPYTDTNYPENSHEELLRSILVSDTWTALENFRLIYEKAYLMTSGNFDAIRMQIIEMFNYLSGRLESESATGFFLENLERLSHVRSFNEAYIVAESMIQQLSDPTAHSYSRSTSNVVWQTLHYIRQNYNQDITLAETARSIHISPSYLSMLFRKETGKTFSRFLTDIRLENACRCLRETDHSITEVSTLNGFSSQSYFIRVFRAHFGVTPKQYRKKHETPAGVPLT